MHPVVIAGSDLGKRGKQDQQQIFGIFDPS